MKIWWDTTNSPSMNANMCFLCISLILLVLLATYLSLETALWICWHCNGGKIKFPVNNRLLDSQQAFDFHLKYLHGPKKLRTRMNEDYPSTCPHNSGPCAFMLNIVSKFVIHIYMCVWLNIHDVFLLHRDRWAWRDIKILRVLFLDIIALRDRLLAELGLRRTEELMRFSEQHWVQWSVHITARAGCCIRDLDRQ